MVVVTMLADGLATQVVRVIAFVVHRMIGMLPFLSITHIMCPYGLINLSKAIGMRKNSSMGLNVDEELPLLHGHGRTISDHIGLPFV
ncbi:hypothetical protein Pyn_04530 [Prunus yedoensis var. nudiflora]|uniref:Uncharacterized protein n=1 Tax=Prunus yedoensis var. nudiflora TaxID=2094558 RepID=A0A314UGQ7_PRUYE|nr:hypothetical protein Pyn_04530 [Prunus yedoensis var. nudiflora]